MLALAGEMIMLRHIIIGITPLLVPALGSHAV